MSAHPINPTPATFLFVHGAWHGSWIWNSVRAQLDEVGVASEIVELPSRDTSRPTPASLQDDADSIVEVLNRIRTEVILVAHSYGGIPATQAAFEGANVAHLIYVAAFRLPAGISRRAISGIPESDLDYLPPKDPRFHFFNDLSEADAAEAALQLVPHSSRTLSETLNRGAEELQSTSYVMTTLDQGVPLALQEQMASGIPQTRMQTGHSPFLAAPEELTRILLATAEEQSLIHPERCRTANCV